MDPVTLILTALAAGAAAGVGDTATQAIKDGYTGLMSLLKSRFAGNAKAEHALANHEEDPETYEKPLAKQLEVTGAAQDPEVAAAARQLVETANAAGVMIKYQNNIRGGRNAIGDNARYVENAAGGETTAKASD